jgi:hypothetical protein
VADAVKLGKILALARRARSAIGVGCLASQPDDCKGGCGGHRTTGWDLNPREVIQIIGSEPGEVVELIAEGDEMAERCRTLAAGLESVAWLARHASEATSENAEERCHRCATVALLAASGKTGGLRAARCGEARDHQQLADAAYALIREVDGG